MCLSDWCAGSKVEVVVAVVEVVVAVVEVVFAVVTLKNSYWMISKIKNQLSLID